MDEDKNKKISDDLDSILEDLKEENKKLSEVSLAKDSDESLKKVLLETQKNIQRALELISKSTVGSTATDLSLKLSKDEISEMPSGAQRIIEGVFNGEAMVGGDGKRYNIPANYASKSKLVEGDILKLTIAKNGSFIYKQIGPIERQQLITNLAYDEATGDWYAVKDSKRWKLLTASVTYFKGEAGDEVVIIIPKNSKSNWAAVENIIKT